METLRATLLALSFLCLVPALAHAQDREDLLERVDPARRRDARAELDSIDHQSDLATAGYVTSTITHVAGMGMMFGGAIGGFCLNLGSLYGGGSSCPDRTGWNVLAGVGAGMTVVGLVGIFVSIGVDVGSGRRRNEWRERFGIADLALSVAPSDDGAVVTVAGRF